MLMLTLALRSAARPPPGAPTSPPPNHLAPPGTAAPSPSHARVRVPRRASESFPRPRFARDSPRARERSSLPLVDARRDDVRRSIARVVVVFIIFIVVIVFVIVIIGRCLPEHEHETERNRTNERTNERDRLPTLPRAPSPSLSRSRAALSPSLSIRVETDARARGRRVTARAHRWFRSIVRVYVSYCTPNDRVYASITAERPSIRWYSITQGRLCVHTTYRVSVSTRPSTRPLATDRTLTWRRDECMNE